MKISKTITFLLVCIPLGVFAHGDEGHSKKKPLLEFQEPNITKQSDTYKSINIQYIKNIKPIFAKKCFDCHGQIKEHPWYYSVPGIKQMIEYDITEAKKHLDMSKDFPFISHESPLQDLISLKEIAIDGDMPPFRYLLGHWDSRLTELEKQALMKWSDNSIIKLKGVHHE